MQLYSICRPAIVKEVEGEFHTEINLKEMRDRQVTLFCFSAGRSKGSVASRVWRKPSPASTQARFPCLEDLERQEVEAALKRHGWVRARAARELGITQRQIGYRIKKYELQPPDYESGGRTL